MSSERKKILDMLADGKINADEADRLLSALENHIQPDADKSTIHTESAGNPKFLHVQVKAHKGSCNHKHENVDIKIPLMLLKAGIKIGSIVPAHAKAKFSSHLSEKGLDIDLNKLKSEDIEALVQALTESSIDIDADDEKVRIYCS